MIFRHNNPKLSLLEDDSWSNGLKDFYHQNDDTHHQKDDGRYYWLSKFHQKDDKNTNRNDLSGSIGTSLGKTCLGISQQKVVEKKSLERCNFHFTEG